MSFRSSSTTLTRTLLTALPRSSSRSIASYAKPTLRPLQASATLDPRQTRTFRSTAIMSDACIRSLQDKKSFDTALEEKDALIVLDCFATWCGPCKVIAPQVTKFAKTYDTSNFYKLDVDEVPEVAQKLNIKAIPTFVLFKNKEKVGEIIGANPKALEAAIKKELGVDKAE